MKIRLERNPICYMNIKKIHDKNTFLYHFMVQKILWLFTKIPIGQCKKIKIKAFLGGIDLAYGSYDKRLFVSIELHMFSTFS